MTYGVAIILYLVVAILTSAVVGWVSDEMDGSTSLEDVLQIAFVSAIWPVFWIISTPILSRRMRNYIRRRRATRLEKRIRVEAEVKLMRSKQARSAHLRPIRRRLDLSK